MSDTARTLFDPQLVPVLWADHDLPAVDADSLQPEVLRRRFISPPHWSPELMGEPRFLDREPAQAAVLIPIVTHPQPTVLLTQRAAHLSTHSGQIAFPGGKCDPGDADAVATALREAHEEIGLDPTQVEVLGCLPTYVTGSMFHITPVVGLVAAGTPWRAHPREVSDVFEVPLHFLMNPAHHRHHRVRWQGVDRHWLSMPYPQPLSGPTQEVRFIWGATAAMLRNLYGFLRA
ncbi:MAG: CoA pyrophosphatase [Rhodoferax sp.]